MTFVQAIKTCFKKYVTFSERASRSEYWGFVVGVFVVSVLLTIMNSLIFGPEILVEQVIKQLPDGTQETGTEVTKNYSGGIVGSIWSLVCFLPVLAVTWRRMHDIGKPGYLPFLTLGAALLVVAAFALIYIGPASMFNVLSSGGSASVRVPFQVFLIIVVSFLLALIVNFGWLARPSDPNTNIYGPNPNEASQ